MAYRSAMKRRVTLAAALLIGTATLSGPAWAADDGYQNVFQSVLGAVGLLPQDHSPEIDYRERAPLVLPPKSNLVAPEAPGAHRTAAWPKDPDVIAREQAEEDAKSPMASMFDKHNSDRIEPKSEIVRQRAAQTEAAQPEYCRASQHGDAACRLSPAEMQREDADYRASNPQKASTDIVTAGVEPERDYLTQPPKGYLKPTKTVKATAEAPYIQRDPSKPLSTLLPHPVDEQESPNN